MTIQRIYSRAVDAANLGDSAQAAAQRLHARSVGCLVVQSPEHRPIGMVTDRDLAVRVVGEGRNPSTTPLSEVMTPSVCTVKETAELEEVLRLMRKGSFRRLPVVDERGAIVGIITLDDILQALAEEFRDIKDLLQEESPDSLASIRIPEKVCL